jgi:hypothetical protein
MMSAWPSSMPAFEADQRAEQRRAVGEGDRAGEAEPVTASANAEPFSFVYYGDAQNDHQEHWSHRLLRQVADAHPVDDRAEVAVHSVA